MVMKLEGSSWADVVEEEEKILCIMGWGVRVVSVCRLRGRGFGSCGAADLGDWF